MSKGWKTPQEERPNYKEYVIVRTKADEIHLCIYKESYDGESWRVQSISDDEKWIHDNQIFKWLPVAKLNIPKLTPELKQELKDHDAKIMEQTLKLFSESLKDLDLSKIPTPDFVKNMKPFKSLNSLRGETFTMKKKQKERHKMSELIEMSKLTINIPKEMHKKLKTIAIEQNTTMTNLALCLLEGMIHRIDEINKPVEETKRKDYGALEVMKEGPGLDVLKDLYDKYQKSII